MKILIVHAIANPGKARRTSINHAFFLPKYAPEHSYWFHCYGHPITSRLRQSQFDAIILDTTFLCWRWAKPRTHYFDQILENYSFIRHSDAVKIALPQDEYNHSELLDEWFTAWGIDVIYSVCYEHRGVFYPKSSARAEILLGLTGFIDDADIRLAEKFAKPSTGRPIDVGYRAKKLPPKFGRFGMVKSAIGEQFLKCMEGRPLRIDISLRPEDVFYGNEWLRFLGNCRFTLGCESGSSLLDPRGEVGDRIAQYLVDHPSASFEEIEAACFPGEDQRHVFSAISPRIFEAALAGTCNILVPGQYLGVLKADEHYIPMKQDLSNADEVYDKMQDLDGVAERIRASKAALITSTQFRYSGFTDHLLNAITTHLTKRGRVLGDSRTGNELNGRGVQSTVTPVSRHACVERALLRSERKRADVEGLSCNGNFWTRQSAKSASSASSQQPGQGLRRRPMRVTMLLQGSWKNDTRVIREADALAQNGFEVCVIYRIEGEGKIERRGQVIYHGIPQSAPYGVRGYFAVFRLHLQVMWRDLRWITQSLSADWIRVCAEYTVLSLLGCVLIVLLPVLVLILAAARIIARPLRSLWQSKGTDKESSRSLPCRLVMWVVSPCRLALAYLLQPLGYLDDFAYACGDAIMLIGPDVIHAHDLVTLSAGALVSERLGCRLVYDAHELETKRNYSYNAWTRYWVTRYEATLARSADRVVTVCNSIADYLAQAYDIKRPVVVMNSPKMDGTAVRMSETLRSTLKLSTGIPIMVYVGLVTINRGLEHCVKALTYLPDVHFATVGPRYSVTEQKLVEIADSLGVRNRLHFVDPVPTEQVVSFVRDADCSVMAIQNVCLSYYFCFPNKLLESVLAGLPVVVADLLEMRRFVEQYNVGVIMNEKDPKSIAHAIRMVLDNSSRYRPTPEKIQNITATYGWAVQQERMLQLYGDLTVSS